MSERRRRTPHQRKELREAVLLTVISVAFVISGSMILASGELLWGLTGVTFFGACLIVGVAQWISAVRRDAPESPRSARLFVAVMSVAALLMGTGSACLFVIALFHWEAVAPATTSLYPRAIALVAGAVGAVFFGGGGVLMAIRLRRK